MQRGCERDYEAERKAEKLAIMVKVLAALMDVSEVEEYRFAGDPRTVAGWTYRIGYGYGWIHANGEPGHNGLRVGSRPQAELELESC